MREGRVDARRRHGDDRDVEERVAAARDRPRADVAERDLRAWLLERASLTSS